MGFSPLMEELIDALKILPGVGPKTAQRMALTLLERHREGALKLSSVLVDAVENIGHCLSCQNFSEEDECGLCRSPRRDSRCLCVVESPADVLAIEQAGTFSGRYFVLHGHLSPIDGIGPEEIGLDKLERRLAEADLDELILATNPTVEGEATAHYITQRSKRYGVPVSRIAHGVPLGGELEYVDGGTLSHAFSGRRIVSE